MYVTIENTCNCAAVAVLRCCTQGAQAAALSLGIWHWGRPSLRNGQLYRGPGGLCQVSFGCKWSTLVGQQPWVRSMTRAITWVSFKATGWPQGYQAKEAVNQVVDDTKPASSIISMSLWICTLFWLGAPTCRAIRPQSAKKAGQGLLRSVWDYPQVRSCAHQAV